MGNCNFTYKANGQKVLRKNATATVGGAAVATSKPSGSPDGVFPSGEPRTIKTTFIEGRNGLGGYYKDEVLEATTDGSGNVTFSYARGGAFEKTHKTNRTNYVEFELQAGSVNGETFNIDWSKVNSIKGQTYNLRDYAKKAGLKWDSKGKMWKK